VDRIIAFTARLMYLLNARDFCVFNLVHANYKCGQLGGALFAFEDSGYERYQSMV